MGEAAIDRTRRDWYLDATIYELHIRAFVDSDADGIGDFAGLTERLDYLRELGITAIWLLPFYPSPLRDDGYDIADYRSVNPAYGTLTDFKRFLRAAHSRGLRVITELVLNHTSDQHPWFQRARRAKPGSRWRDWYVWSDDPERYREARIIFQDFEASNWTWDPVAGAYFWHRFYSHQPDLNYENPEVRAAAMRVIDFWFDLGVDGLRLDAVPYLYEAEGTNCENLAATHAFLKELRAHIDARHPDRMLLAEANQWPEDAAAYFGDGDECHMNFHFPLMPRLFMALQMEDRYPVIDILNQTPPIPAGCQWALFLRNHDELTLEMVTDEERDYMYRVFAGEQQARINLGIRRRLAPLLGNDRAQIRLLTGLLLSLPGTPVIYYGDEIAMGDNVYLGDRDSVRTPMQWNADRNAGFSKANPQRLYLPVIIDPAYHYEAVNVQAHLDNPTSLLWWMRRILGLRRRHPVFGRGDIEFLHPDNPHVLVYVRSYEGSSVLVAANLSRHAQYVELDLQRFRGITPTELFGALPFPTVGDSPYVLTLGPHAFYWLSFQSADELSTPDGEVPVLSAAGRTWGSVFEPEGWPALAQVFQQVLPRQHWFRVRGKHPREVEVVDVAPLDVAGGEAAIVLVDVGFAAGEPARVSLPLVVADDADHSHPAAVMARVKLGNREGLLLDGMLHDGMIGALASAITRRRRIAGPAGGVVGRTTAAMRGNGGSTLPGLPVRPLVGQANSLAVFGERYLMKVFRILGEGLSPEHEMGLHLAEIGFPNVPALLGTLEQRTGNEPTSLAVLREWVPHEGDAWTHAIAELGRYYEAGLSRAEEVLAAPVPPTRTADLVVRAATWEWDSSPAEAFSLTAAMIGERLGELHAALADHRGSPAFQPERFTKLYMRSLYQSFRNDGLRTLNVLEKVLPQLDEPSQSLAKAVTAARGDVLDRFRRGTERTCGGLRIRIHGNLHLAQVLWTGRDAMFIDLEGEAGAPVGERRIKRSPYRDVAGLMRSFDYATLAAKVQLLERGLSDAPEIAEVVERLRCAWYADTSVALLASYRRAVDGAAFAPSSDEDMAPLLDAYLVHNALTDAQHELDMRRDWLAVPLQGLVTLLELTV